MRSGMGGWASVICGRGGAAASGKCEDGEGELEKKMWSDTRHLIDQIVQTRSLHVDRRPYTKKIKN
jgi:hypothetical protein